MLLKTKHLKPFFSIVAALVLASLTATVSAQSDKEQYIKVTEKGTTYELVAMETNVVYNPYTYTWFAWEEPVYKKKTTEMDKLVPISAFERPPVFTGDGACLAAKDQFACSNRELQDYVSSNIFEYPDPAREKGQEGLEYVTFTLDENGKFEGKLKVVSRDKNNPCEGCADAAADLVASMEDMWFPAIKDGKTVKTQLTVPVRFKLLER